MTWSEIALAYLEGRCTLGEFKLALTKLIAEDHDTDEADFRALAKAMVNL